MLRKIIKKVKATPAAKQMSSLAGRPSGVRHTMKTEPTARRPMGGKGVPNDRANLHPGLRSPSKKRPGKG